MQTLQDWFSNASSRTLAIIRVLFMLTVVICVLAALPSCKSSDSDSSDVVIPTPVASIHLSGATVIAAPPQPGSGSVTVVTAPASEGTGWVFGYGIQAHGVVGDPEQTIGAVKKLGLGWVKQQVNWNDFSPAKGQMDWSGFDRVIEAANTQGIKVMLSVVDAPQWARSDLATYPQGAPPDNYQDLGDFLVAMAQRYQGKIHAIEVWNEQNLDREWDTPQGVNAQSYVEMLQVAYQAIKSVDPSVIVISGALSPTGANLTDANNPNRSTVIDDMVYFDQMLQAGLLDYTDCVGAHHNGINIPPDVAWNQDYQDDTATYRGYWDNPHPSWSFKSTIWGYHEKIIATGQSKPICVTEFGWASSEGLGGSPPDFGFADDNTLQEQVDFIIQAYQMLRNSEFVHLAFLWNLDFAQKDGIGPDDPNAPYSITDFIGVPRPAFGAVEQMLKP